ncbi:MAG TPA: hypothetical protein VNE58_03555 [Casimicrobiaceae bacterium]|nr:hypothetical protein [Casimicrobiaceae bacterium]
MRDTRKTAIDAGKVLDALTALSLELKCKCEGGPDRRLVLESHAVKEACDAIDDAVASLKDMLIASGRANEALGDLGDKPAR